MSKDFPNSMDIQKDINDFLSQKYGGKVILSNPNVEGGEEGVPSETEEAPSHHNFDLKPIELESYLKEYIVEQGEAIETIATKICTHFNRMAYEASHPECDKIVGGIKGNILMIGPTGVGKTYMIKLIAEKLEVPFVKGDATKFTETGYVGGDVEDLIRDLVHEADGNIELAEYGIVYLDEVDKIASTGNQFGPDVSRSGVQRNLLKVLEETEVDLKNPLDIASQMEAAMQAQKTGHVERKRISTKNILFVMSGAFQGMTDIIRKRLNAQTLGFSFDEK
ncbi:MAG TPA: AAA family ATPase, partial [Spirochaetes bacterium]|nr:AAA family ATPase [Spirochaetota bacterium]